jgi:hypothetical protein
VIWAVRLQEASAKAIFDEWVSAAMKAYSRSVWVGIEGGRGVFRGGVVKCDLFSAFALRCAFPALHMTDKPAVRICDEMKKTLGEI